MSNDNTAKSTSSDARTPDNSVVAVNYGQAKRPSPIRRKFVIAFACLFLLSSLMIIFTSYYFVICWQSPMTSVQIESGSLSISRTLSSVFPDTGIFLRAPLSNIITPGFFEYLFPKYSSAPQAGWSLRISIGAYLLVLLVAVGSHRLLTTIRKRNRVA